jgi:hypothetical protein
MRRSVHASIGIYMIVLIASCGVRDNDETRGEASEDLNLSPTEQLIGQWNGLYRALENGRPFGDATETNLQLNENGRFLLKLSSNDSAQALGDWSEFQGRSLIMKISGSTIPRFGVAGKLIEPSYELLGQSLRIAGENFEIKLSKKSEGSGGDTGGNRPDPRIRGAWICKTTSGRTTKLQVSNGSSFSLTSTTAGERMFLATGTVTAAENGISILRPSRMSDPLPDGSFFQLEITSDRSELKLLSPKNDFNKTLGNCANSD